MRGNSKMAEGLIQYPWQCPQCSFLLLFLVATSRASYGCQVNNKNGTTLEFTSPSYVKQHVRARGYQTIECKAVNFCRILWLKDNVTYPWRNKMTTTVALEDKNQTLRFESADEDAQGFYTCLINNETSSIQRTTQLKVDGTFWNGKPLHLGKGKFCQNQTAEIGENRTFSCIFFAGPDAATTLVYWARPNVSSTENETEWLSIGSMPPSFTEYQQLSIIMDKRHAHNLSENETPYIQNILQVINVSQDAYGIYKVIANNDGEVLEVILDLSPPDEEPLSRDYLKPCIALASIVIFAAVSLLIWKIVALDVKIWFMDHFSEDEQNDNKLYDAYISYSWNNNDREFVFNVLMPYLEKLGYKLFIPEIHTIPSNVFLEELSKAMESSRRCIMVITPNFTTSQFGQYEVHHATDLMSSKLSKHIIPIFLGVTPCYDSAPLSCPSSPASLSSLSSPSGSQNDIDEISTSSSSQISQDMSLSISSSSLSADSTPPNTSRPVKIDFRFCPLLGQLIPVLKPLHTIRKVPGKVCNYTRFLKKLRLRMPKPPLYKTDSNLHQEMVTVSHTKNLVENEVLPEGSGADAGEVMQTIPRLCPKVPIINSPSATGFHQASHWRSSPAATSVPGIELYPVVSIINPTSATSFHQEPQGRPSAASGPEQDLYPVISIINPASATSHQEPQGRPSAASDPEQDLYPLVSIINPASATNFHQETKGRSSSPGLGFWLAVNDTTPASTWLGI